jgi:hypothetical protein
MPVVSVSFFEVEPGLNCVGLNPKPGNNCIEVLTELFFDHSNLRKFIPNYMEYPYLLE